MKKIIFLLLLSSLFIILSGCEALFTTSVFESLAKSPSEMSTAELETYAETVLSSGNSEDMAETFTAVEASLPETAEEDTEAYLLATDLALGGSGLTDAITDIVPDIMEGSIDDTFDYQTVLDSLDDTLIASSVDLFTEVAAVEGAEISESQYVNAAVAQALVLIDEAGGDVSAVDDTDPRIDLITAWAEAGGVDVSAYLSL